MVFASLLSPFAPSDAIGLPNPTGGLTMPWALMPAGEAMDVLYGARSLSEETRPALKARVHQLIDLGVTQMIMETPQARRRVRLTEMSRLAVAMSPMNAALPRRCPHAYAPMCADGRGAHQTGFPRVRATASEWPLAPGERGSSCRVSRSTRTVETKNGFAIVDSC